MSKKEQLEKLNNKMAGCSKCALKKGCKNVVAGEGSAEAEIMFIGEGPGAKEDELGRPFVGAAGKFLDEMLASIGLDRREDVYPHTKIVKDKNNNEKYNPNQKNKLFGVGIYITNVVKCRPPNNRDPLPEEVAECWPWLMEQIKIIKPKLIITLGRHSMARFLPEMKISEVHGQAMRREIEGIGQQARQSFAEQNLGGQIFFVLYHPAAALYNGSLREVLLKDFKKIPKVLEKINELKINQF